MAVKNLLATADRLSLLTFLMACCLPLAAQVPLDPPAVKKSEFDSPEAEKFKKLLATGGIDRGKVAPDTFLPPGNRRTSQPGALRVYKKGEDGKPLSPQPKGFPRTVDPDTFIPAEDEFVRRHEGVDFSSKDAKGNVREMDFKAGVYGKVVAVGTDDRLGRIVVEVDGRKNRVEYLHTSKSLVQVGDEVKPDTLLGMTGDKGANGAIHLHVQARNKDDKAINPDEVVSYARKSPSERKEAGFFVPMKWREPVPPATPKVDITEKARREAKEAEEQRKRLEKEFPP